MLFELLRKLAVSRLAVGLPPIAHGDVVRPERLADRVYADLTGATPVEIGEVAERFFVKERREGWAFTRDFGDVSPPFDLFFLESGRPSRVLSESGDMDPELVPGRWGVLFEVMGEASGWSAAELALVAESMGFDRARTQSVYAVNFITDEDGIDVIRPDGEGRLYHRLKDRVYLWAQTWFFPIDGGGRISRHPNLMLAPAYRGVRQEWLAVFSERMHLLCFPSLYALGRLNSGAARLEPAEDGAGRYRLADMAGGQGQGSVAAPPEDARKLREAFRAALTGCGGRGGDGALDAECVNRLVGKNPAGAEAFVAACCAGAAPDEGDLGLAAEVAMVYEEVFDDPVLRRRVIRRAEEIGSTQVVDLLRRADDDGVADNIH